MPAHPDPLRRVLKPVRRGHRMSLRQLIPVLLLLLAVQGWDEIQRFLTPPSEGLASIRAAYENERSGVNVEAAGRIRRVLPDDNDGDRHQRFILDIDRRHSVLVAHNIDLAPRVPAEEGDEIRFRGRYEWSEQGGTIHWTHHDPRGRTPGGWIELDGRRYE